MILLTTGCAGVTEQSLFSQDWQRAGFSAWASPPWIKAGFSPEEAQLWRSDGITVENAAAWRAIGADYLTSKTWRELGFPTPADARPWLQALRTNKPDTEFTQLNPEAAAHFRDAGMTPAELSTYRDAGLDPASYSYILDIRALLPESGSIAQAVAYAKDGVKPGGVAQYEASKKKRVAERAIISASIKAGTYIKLLHTKFDKQILFKSQSASDAVHAFNIDCKMQDGRLIPLINILLVGISQMQSEKSWALDYVEEAGGEVRIFQSIENAQGPVTSPFLAFEINKWNELHPHGIPTQAIFAACDGLFGPIWISQQF